FQQRWRALKSTWDQQVGITQFEELCQRFEKGYPTFIAELRKKRDHYLAFLKYPDAVRRSLSTTNIVEAVNGQLERIRRNSGGYFQSDDTLKLKLGMTITSLEKDAGPILHAVLKSLYISSTRCFRLDLRRRFE